MRPILATASAAAIALTAGAAAAEEHVVEMLNKGPDGERMVFEPAVIHAEPGDTVRFVPVDKGHNAATINQSLPDEAAPFRGGINQEVTYEISETGVHVVQCTPHYGLGMIALIVSGDDYSNVEQAADSIRPRKAEQRFETYLEEARAES